MTGRFSGDEDSEGLKHAVRDLTIGIPFVSLSIGAHLRAVGATFDPYSGSMYEVVGHIDWYVSRNFGLGGAYEYSKLKFEKDTATRFIRFEHTYDGPEPT